MTRKPIRAIIVEDHEIMRLGLKKALERTPDVSVIAEISDGKTAVEKSLELKPDLVLMDIGLPGMDGIHATRKIKESLSTKVIIVTSHDNDEDIFAGLAAGADAYCLKDIEDSRLVNAVNTVMDGAVWIDPGIAERVLAAVKRGSKEDLSVKAPKGEDFRLSERELQVLGLVVSGLTNQEIADQLGLGTETVKTHLRHIMEKLKVSDRTQAAVKALRKGLIGL